MPDKQDNFKDQLLQDLTTFQRKMKTEFNQGFPGLYMKSRFIAISTERKDSLERNTYSA